MQTEQLLAADEQQAIEYVKDLKGFYSHLIKYLVIITGLFIFNLIKSPDTMWVYWVIFGWGIGVLSHALSVLEIFSFFGADWEKKRIEKRLGRKL